MAKKKTERAIFDPLNQIDPVMEEAFSVHSQPDRKEADSPTVSDIQFPELTPTKGDLVSQDIFNAIPVTVAVELGKAQVSLKDMYELSEGSIIELERLVGEPLDLLINDQLIAKGEVVAIDNNYGLRITQLISKNR